MPGDILHPHQFDLAEYQKMMTDRGCKLEQSILYKEDREKEIKNLQSELQELKSKISDNENNYSESLEKVSNSINNFLEKIN
mgnify:CR=1 FL=1